MATPGVTITGTLTDLSGTANAGRLVWTLVNFGDNPPLINGTALVAPITIVTQAAVDGTFSQALWGSYQITPSTTFYQVGILGADGSQTIVAAYQFTAGGSFDLSTLNPLNNIPGIGVNTPSISKIAHQWLDSYTSTTGVFTQSQPAFTDISGTLTAAQEPSTTVNTVVNDTNVTGSISAQALTLGFTGTVAAGRLNSNVVQAVTNDTNVHGTIATQNLTLSWNGQLALSRGGTNADLSASGGTTKILAQDASHVISARDLVAGDIPNLSASKITSGQIALAVGGTNADLSATGGTSQVLKQTTVGGNVTVGQLAFSDISGTAAAAQYVSMVGDSGSGGTKGAVPAPASGDAAAGKFLKANGTWAVPAGGGGGITNTAATSIVPVTTDGSGDLGTSLIWSRRFDGGNNCYKNSCSDIPPNCYHERFPFAVSGAEAHHQLRAF
jgi:hypothetical protein